MKRSTSLTQRSFPNGLLMAILSTLAFMLFALAPAALMSTDLFTIIGCGVFLLVLLYIVWAGQRGQALDSARRYLRFALVVWWSLLVSEVLFVRQGTDEAALAGNFAPSAYYEAILWGGLFLALLVILIRGFEHLRGSSAGPNKWLSLFALVALFSVSFSPKPLYSLAWAFKLLLVVLVLLICSNTICDLNDMESFFWSTFWGFVVLIMLPVARAFANPATAFEGGRLTDSASPTGLAASAGTLLLLALTLNSARKKPWLVGFAIVGATVMLLTGGKAGIISGIASVILFFAVQKRLGAGLGWVLAVSVLGCVVLATTPMASYFWTYQEQNEIVTLTGRTDLWAAAWAHIKQHPILGAGYVAGRFLSLQVEGIFPEAGHLHNGFLEVLYNNGIVGLVPVVAMHVAILRNLAAVLRAAGRGESNVMAIGILALYTNILITGSFNATFGGRAYAPFMLLMGLVIVSQTLRKMTCPRPRTAP
jgi:O-antigen ligase